MPTQYDAWWVPQVPANWTRPGIIPNYGWLEGNAVAGPDGYVYDVLRVNSAPTANKAALTKILAPDKPPVFDRCVRRDWVVLQRPILIVASGAAVRGVVRPQLHRLPWRHVQVHNTL